ncbi:MAG: Secretion system C-terminal sorting domain [Bacteroidota bacterium]|jgi:hypothetical protein
MELQPLKVRFYPKKRSLDSTTYTLYMRMVLRGRSAKADEVDHPNPAQHQVTVRYANLELDSRLLIVNIFGEVIEERMLSVGASKLLLSTESYPNGVYLARIETGSKVLLKEKFIILK